MGGISFREKYQHAAIGRDLSVLSEIARPSINLAVWKNAGAALKRDAYLQALDLDALGPGLAWRDDYFKILTTWKFNPAAPAKQRRWFESGLEEQMEEAGFPAQGPGPLLGGRRRLANQIISFADIVAQQAAGSRVGFSLLLFRPDDNMFWHTDGGPMRGIITLRGDTGTLWRPEPTLSREYDRRAAYWGDVQPEQDKDKTQAIEPGDLAVFKCRAAENPLVHASPVCQKTRLTMVMSPR